MLIFRVHCFCSQYPRNQYTLPFIHIHITGNDTTRVLSDVNQTATIALRDNDQQHTWKSNIFSMHTDCLGAHLFMSPPQHEHTKYSKSA